MVAASFGCKASCLEDDGVPAFKHARIAELCYFMLGAGMLTGWNAFLTASDYFNATFPGRSIDRVFTVAYLPITVVFMGLVSRWPRALCTAQSRIIIAYSLFSLCCAAVPVIDIALVQKGATQAAYGLTMLCVTLVAFGDGIAQTTVFADTALLPDRYTQWALIGGAASGVIIGVLRLVTKASQPQTLEGLRASTQVYFALSAFIAASALLLHQLVLPRLDVVVFFRARLQEDHLQVQQQAGLLKRAAASKLDSSYSHLSQATDSCQDVMMTVASLKGPLTQPSDTDESGSLVIDIEGHDDMVAAMPKARHAAAAAELEQQPPRAQQQPQQQACHQQPVQRQQQMCSRNTSSMHQTTHAVDAAVHSEQLCVASGGLSWGDILKLNWHLSLAACITYAITLSIFPGFLAENVHSASMGSWYPVSLIFTFNVFDFAGRCIPDFGWRPSHSVVLMLALSRLVLIPLYAGLAVYGAPETAFFLLTFALGLSNGWVTTLFFCAAPRGLTPAAAETAGMITVFALMVGLNVGAFLGWLWTIGQ